MISKNVGRYNVVRKEKIIAIEIMAQLQRIFF